MQNKPNKKKMAQKLNLEQRRKMFNVKKLVHKGKEAIRDTKIVVGAIRTVHDEDCLRCGFPETVDVRDPKTFDIIFRECSKGCGWMITGEELKRLNEVK